LLVSYDLQGSFNYFCGSYLRKSFKDFLQNIPDSNRSSIQVEPEDISLLCDVTGQASIEHIHPEEIAARNYSDIQFCFFKQELLERVFSLEEGKVIKPKEKKRARSHKAEKPSSDEKSKKKKKKRKRRHETEHLKNADHSGTKPTVS